ncbi:hypothetical protein DFR50_119106 [Roseiarcus fermentans]|uniref:Uncharacterized protein n=1 Tax=Roseiarcus fermentans TaxID=1473586 RepID=A0A366F9N5_9HYPH|nr:hypothetical protein [Roseiarcus fermentans]RBP10435.1 hypothetical protein DFR50_119106 [Roseiarcus fermentans]
MERTETLAAVFAGAGFDGPVSMQLDQARKPKEHCLRFVFQDKVVSFDVAADLSFGDVARALRELVPRHYGEPVSIDCIRTIMSSAVSCL